MSRRQVVEKKCPFCLGTGTVFTNGRVWILRNKIQKLIDEWAKPRRRSRR